MAAVPGSSGTGEDVTTKPTPEDPVSDTGDKGEEYVIRVDDTRSSKIRTPSKLPRIPLAPGLFDQNQLPRCGEKHVPPVCYHQTDWYKFKLMTFDPSTQYDFLMNTHGKVRWFDVNGWKATDTYKKAMAIYHQDEGVAPDPYYGHQSMLTSTERERIPRPETSPVIYGGEFYTDKRGHIEEWNGGSGHFQLQRKSWGEAATIQKKKERYRKRYEEMGEMIKTYREKYAEMGEMIAKIEKKKEKYRQKYEEMGETIPKIEQEKVIYRKKYEKMDGMIKIYREKYEEIGETIPKIEQEKVIYRKKYEKMDGMIKIYREKYEEIGETIPKIEQEKVIYRKKYKDMDEMMVKIDEAEKGYREKHKKMGKMIAKILGIDRHKFVVAAHQIAADILLDFGIDYDIMEPEEKHEFTQSIVDDWIHADEGREPYPYVPSHHEIHQGYNDYEFYVFGGAAIVSLFVIFCIGLAFGIVICWGCRQRKELEERKASEEDFNP
eukprot:756598_1